MKNRELPNSVESEIALLGSIMLRPPAINQVLDMVKNEDFFKAQNRMIFEAMKVISERGDFIDLVSISEFLKNENNLKSAGGIIYLSELTESVPTSYNIKNYAKIIKEKSQLRSILEVGRNVIDDSMASLESFDIIQKTQEKLIELNSDNGKNTTSNFKDTSKECELNKATNSIIDMLENGNPPGVRTGFNGIDRVISLRPGEYSLWAARPSMGKTSLMMNIVENIAKRGEIVPIFTIEMTKQMLIRRLILGRSGQSEFGLLKAYSRMSKFNEYTEIDEIKNQIYKAASHFKTLPIIINDHSSPTLEYLRSKLTEIRAEYGPFKVAFVDYLQIMQAKEGINSPYERISYISSGLKQLAKDLNIHLAVLSQLNRNVDMREPSNQMPFLSDLRESGKLEEDADIILFFVRWKKAYENKNEDCPVDLTDVASWSIKKNRNGPLSQGDLRWNGLKSRFYSETQDYEENEAESYYEPEQEDLY